MLAIVVSREVVLFYIFPMTEKIEYLFMPVEYLVFFPVNFLFVAD